MTQVLIREAAYVVCCVGLASNPLSATGKVSRLMFYNRTSLVWQDAPDDCGLSIDDARRIATDLRSHHEHSAGIDPAKIYVADQFGNDIDKR